MKRPTIRLTMILGVLAGLQASARAELPIGEALPPAAACSVRSETGLLVPLLQADAVCTGRAVSSGLDPDGGIVVSLGVDELLAGDVSVLGAELVFAGAGWSELDTGAAPEGRLALWLLDRDEAGAWWILSVGIDLEDSSNAGSRELAAAMLAAPDPGARGRAIARVAASCGDRTRRRAALDLESDARHLTGLDARALEDLRLAIAAANDATAVDVLARTYSITAAPDALPVALQAMAGAHGDAVLDSLRRMVATGTLAPGPADLEPYLALHVDPKVRRRAAALLARVPDEWVAPRLEELTGDPDLDTGALALSGLAGRASSETLSRCRDLVRLTLDTRPRGFELATAAPLERRLEARDLRALRIGQATGRRLRLLAAGFVLARAGEDDRQWLADCVDHLSDRNAGRFMSAMLQAPWADFQGAW